MNPKLLAILKRMLQAIPIMIGVAVAVFLFMRLSPGDPVDIMLGEEGNVTEREIAALREEFHLDKPLLVQLKIFLWGLLRGDLGNSISTRQPVGQILLATFPATLELALGALLFSLVVAVPIGILSAAYRYSWLDRLSMGGAFLGISMPAFWFGILAILIFAVELKWLPTSGRLPPGVFIPEITGLYTLDALLAGDWRLAGLALKHLILPSVTLGAAPAAVVARIMRSSMVEVLQEQYVVVARAKGLPELVVLLRHALRNALIPTVTVVGLQVGVLLGGNMIVETIFGWPGLGRLVVASIYNRDFPVVQGAVMLYALTYVVANLVVDVLYTYLNPKIEL